MVRFIWAAFIYAAVVAYFVILNTSFRDIPALGHLLSPYVGFWQNAETEIQESDTIELQYQGMPVMVTLDSALIPTIESACYPCLYYAQGYITAKHRLWQMELQTRAAAGRLSEILGERTEAYDVFMRRIGMAEAAETALEAIMSDDTTRMVVEAYTAGVNAWIEQLAAKQYPIEYKILHHKPEPWTPLKCANLLKYMSFDLSFNNDDARLSQLAENLGRPLVDLLFPDYPYIDNPIIRQGKFDFKAQPCDGSQVKFNSFSAKQTHPDLSEEYAKGSNNWAVTRSKTVHGYAILANDPHLNLTLPSIWYVCKMKLNNHFRVAGATLPGAPGIIIGFNEYISWGVTNGYADVLDWYKVDYQIDSKGSGNYLLNGIHKNTKLHTEVIRIKGKNDRIEHVHYTLAGPIVAEHDSSVFRKDVPVGAALRWTAHDPGNELKTFICINQAKNLAQYQKALSFYNCPAQNFIYADVQKQIAIFPNTGKIPVRCPGNGRYVTQLTDSSQLWSDFIPRNQLPKSINPSEDYVYSANQSTASKEYPYYLGADFGSPDRAFRIEAKLKNMHSANIDSIKAMQIDDYNHFASLILPFMLHHITSVDQKLSVEEKRLLHTLKTWDYCHHATSKEAVLFFEWWQHFADSLWKPIIKTNILLPKRYNTAALLLRQDSVFRKIISLHPKQSLQKILIESWAAALNKLKKLKSDSSSLVDWGSYKNTHIDHVGRIPGFGTGFLVTGGSKSCINAMSERNGPSWRMVVDMQPPRPVGRFIYPGGQSGNPGSRNYQRWVEAWRTGQMHELSLP